MVEAAGSIATIAALKSVWSSSFFDLALLAKRFSLASKGSEVIIFSRIGMALPSRLDTALPGLKLFVVVLL